MAACASSNTLCCWHPYCCCKQLMLRSAAAAVYGPPISDEDCLELLTAVYDDPNASRHFDTAEIYKSGNPMVDNDDDTYNEKQLAPFFASKPRDSFTVATKFMPFKHGGKSDYDTVKAALQGSLNRLGLDYIDLYYCHRVANLAGTLEFAASAKRLQDEGLVRSVGLSEVCGDWLRQAHAICPIAAVQQEWSLMTRVGEPELFPVCAELGVGVVAYSPLARNLLCTTAEDECPRDWRATLPRYSAENWAVNVKLSAEVAEIAKNKGGISAAQLSLAWLFHRADVVGVKILPIPGTTKAAHAVVNSASTGISLSVEEAATLEALAGQTQGLRGDEQYMSIVIEAQADFASTA